jgi:hypothetical protein
MILEMIEEYGSRGEDICRDDIKKRLKGKFSLREIRSVINQLVKEGKLKERHATVGRGRPIYLSIADPDDKKTILQKLIVVIEYLITIMERGEKILKALIRVEEALGILALERK